jgi:hypothetical protein
MIGPPARMGQARGVRVRGVRVFGVRGVRGARGGFGGSGGSEGASVAVDSADSCSAAVDCRGVGQAADGIVRARPSGSRCATASNSRIDPATAALSEPTAPRIGIRMNRSQRRRTVGPRPWPSLPTTIARGPRRSL